MCEIQVQHTLSVTMRDMWPHDTPELRAIEWFTEHAAAEQWLDKKI